MDHAFCPGSKLLRQPKPETIICPSCRGEVEIWSDEVRGTCPSCKRAVFRDAAMACLDWCKYGEQCVGTEVYARYVRNRALGLKHRLLTVLEAFDPDPARLVHAAAVLAEAERLLAAEGGEAHIVIPASILHDVGIKGALEKHGSAEARYQEMEGPPVARKMLLAQGMKVEEIDEICAIIGSHHTPGRVDTPSYRVVYDADRLVNLAEAAREGDRAVLAKASDGTFLTAGGRDRARELYLSEQRVS